MSTELSSCCSKYSPFPQYRSRENPSLGWAKMILQWSMTSRRYSSICELCHLSKHVYTLNRLFFFHNSIPHSCFYLDSPSNAELHGMEAKSKHREQITKRSVSRHAYHVLIILLKIQSQIIQRRDSRPPF